MSLDLTNVWLSTKVPFSPFTCVYLLILCGTVSDKGLAEMEKIIRNKKAENTILGAVTPEG